MEMNVQSMARVEARKSEIAKLAEPAGDYAHQVRYAAYALAERYEGGMPADQMMRAAEILVTVHGVGAHNLRHEGRLVADLRIDVMDSITRP